MKQFELKGTDLSIHFIRRRDIFSGINISATNSEVVGVIGANGSGKTTLLKILSGVLKPSSGILSFTLDNTRYKPDEIVSHIGFVSPYLILYEEFTPFEHLKLSAKFHGLNFNEEWAVGILKKFNLFRRRFDLIKTFSSGMKQRVKYMIALQSEPKILLLDEPFTNLDIDGIDAVKFYVNEHSNSGGGVVVASNDDRELEMCHRTIEIQN